MKKSFFALLISLMPFSCGKETDMDKIGDAQLCLDKLSATAAPADVNQCLEKIDGLESVAAYGLRCAGSFLKEGFLDPKKLTNATSQLDSNSTTGFMGLITFTSAGVIATDTANAYTAFNYCLKGEGKGSTLIASFGYVAMALYQYMNTADSVSCPNSPTSSGYDFSSCVTAYGTNPANLASAANLVDSTATASASAKAVQTSVGTIILSTFNLSCTGRSANSTLCSSIGNAIQTPTATTDPRVIATRFFTQIIP